MFTTMFGFILTCTLMRGLIKGAAWGLNPIDPRGYGPTCSMRADKCIPRALPSRYICFPEYIDFGNVDLSKGDEVAPTLLPSAVQMSFMQGSPEGSYVYGITTWLQYYYL